jgi:DNA-binding LacI/PurR family transcriptional regulator
MRDLGRAGVAVPEDLSCVGFGDEPFAARLATPLTTVRIPQVAIGEALAEGLLAVRAGAGPKRLCITPKLVLRQSVARADVPRETTPGRST